MAKTKGQNSSSGSSGRRSSRRNEFDPDYTYIKKDLRRIAYLTGFFLLVLLALTFILR